MGPKGNKGSGNKGKGNKGNLQPGYITHLELIQWMFDQYLLMYVDNQFPSPEYQSDYQNKNLTE